MLGHGRLPGRVGDIQKKTAGGYHRVGGGNILGFLWRFSCFVFVFDFVLF